MKQRIFTCILTGVILITALCPTFVASAKSDIKTAKCDDVFSEEMLTDEFHIVKNETNSDSLLKFYSNADTPWTFYSNLTAVQKVAYNAIVDNKGGLEIGNNSESTAEILIGFSTKQLYATSLDGLKDNTKNTIIGAMSAVIEDYPEYFWLGNYSYSFSYAYTQTGDFWVTELNLKIMLNTDDYSNFETIRSCYKQMQEKISNFVINGSSRYAKCKSIHDQICKMTVYTTDVAMAHQPTGVFLTGQAVCEGYSEAFKLLCDRENIPCITVVGMGNGGAHKWNYVKMEDGNWYGMDCTWADQGDSGIFYDYFIVGSETYTSNAFGSPATKFGNGTDTEGNHINTGTLYNYDGFSLTYPSISSTSYSGITPIFNSNLVFDNSKNIVFITKDANLTSSLWCTYAPSWAPSNNSASVSGTTTTGTLNITSPFSKTYTVVRWGDVNADGTTDLTDNQIITDVVSGKTVLNNTANFNAADYNQDGVIDAFDMFYADLYVNTGKLVNG